MTFDWGAVISFMSGIIILLLGIVLRNQSRFESQINEQMHEIRDNLSMKLGTKMFYKSREDCRSEINSKIQNLDNKMCRTAEANSVAHDKIWDAFHKHRHNKEDGAVIRGD
jgi:hypothetical protein